MNRLSPYVREPGFTSFGGGRDFSSGSRLCSGGSVSVGVCPRVMDRGASEPLVGVTPPSSGSTGGRTSPASPGRRPTDDARAVSGVGVSGARLEG